MQEIEVKILEIDQEIIEDKLQELGASKSFAGELYAIFYDFSDSSIRQQGDVLRLRKEGEETVLAYKKHIAQGEAKVMEECETLVSDLGNMKTILETLGLKVIKETRKFRTEYTLEDTKIVIDDYQDALEHIPVFIEVEAPNIRRMHEVAKLLGYEPKDCKSWNTYDLAQHYEQK
ncbi:MAG: class IV adenylate cyclase [Spirulinaceae cyanobacterium]